MNAMTTTHTVEGDFSYLVWSIDGDYDNGYHVHATESNGAPESSPYYEERTIDLGTWETIDEARDEIHGVVYGWECAIDEYADRQYERY